MFEIEHKGRLRRFTDRVAYVLPVSDDGGSTAEIVRVLGGPAVGDIRSRCLRLADDNDEEVPASIMCNSFKDHSIITGTESKGFGVWCDPGHQVSGSRSPSILAACMTASSPHCADGCAGNLYD
jgi:hypothetical protein